MMKKSIISLVILFATCLLQAQEGTQFEMSSSQYGVAESVFMNAGSVASGQDYVLRQQFGAVNVGRMQSVTYKIGALVQAPADAAETLPADFRLWQNYPNPFNQSTTFRYAVPKDADITISVVSILGRHIETLYSGMQSAGVFELPFRGVNVQGAGLDFERRGERVVM